MSKGKLYLIPTPLGEGDPAQVLPASVLEVIPTLDCFVVEELRTARRFLSAAGLKGHIDGLEFHELNEHTRPQEVEAFARLFEEGRCVGLLSEAGLPAVADPGALLVALCHRHGIEVVPLVGPSSLMLALMASGLNGQSFAFVGYIPAKTEERRSAIKTLEKRSAAARQTQILIETPYRNDSLLADLLACLNGHTRICVAANLTCPDQFIQTRTVAEWKSNPITIGKRPCVFLILSA
ncbi:MAG: SAM-dependent methyltransferase [Bacteroidales bacterium]|jgi:16S rRNA (cytidine1402-2'-O)-methyltransferase|nr:SAM-dependent methyltransferase [Bacteroidales bacterium]